MALHRVGVTGHVFQADVEIHRRAPMGPLGFMSSGLAAESAPGSRLAAVDVVANHGQRHGVPRDLDLAGRGELRPPARCFGWLAGGS